jgi:hypothetical protein
MIKKLKTISRCSPFKALGISKSRDANIARDDRDVNNCSGARYSREASNRRDVPNNKRDVL